MAPSDAPVVPRIMTLYQAIIPGCKEKWMSGLPFLWKDGPKELQRGFLTPAVNTGFAHKENIAN